MKKKRFLKRLAFRTILRLFIIFVIVSLLASAVIGTISFVSMVGQMRDETYNAALKLASLASSPKIMEKGIDHYFETGTTDEEYNDLWLNLLLIYSNYDLERLDIFVPHEDHVTYLMSSEGFSGDLLNTEKPYYGDEKEYVTNAMNAEIEVEFDPDKSSKKNFYTLNVLNGVDVFTYYLPVLDSELKPVAVVAVSQSADRVLNTIVQNIMRLIGISLAVVLISVILFYFSIRKHIIVPITRLTKSVRTMPESVKSGQTVTTDIHTGDEIEELAVSFEDMDRELIGYIDENTKITAEKQRITTELNLATNIQAGMLPNKFPAFPDRKDFDIYASMKPAKEVGGDFYDFFLIDNNKLGIVMADVSGKGIPAALFMMYSKILLKSYTMMKQSPKAALEEVNRQICESNPQEMFVTVWLGVLDLETGVFTAANAGHEKPAFKKPDGSFELLKDKHGLMVGYMDTVRYREYEFKMTKGSKLFLYTDGVAEANNANEELFGTDRMIEALRTAENKTPKDIIEAVDLAINNFVDTAPQFDDVTMLCIEYFGKEEG